MIFRPNLIISITFFVLSGCAQKSPTEEFVKAAELYNESVDLEMEVRSIFGSLEQVIARDTSLLAYNSELRDLAKEMDEWEQTVFRVGENGAEPLGHQHRSRKEISDEETLARQKKLSAQLVSISDRLVTLMEKMSR